MTKTDNKFAEAKLNLRRHLLNKFDVGERRVLDCCQAEGVMWKQLRSEFKVASYWGVDLKAKPGRLKIDSMRLLEGEIKSNVIDVDTYGSPWKHWQTLLPNIRRPTIVFLTYGRVQFTPIDSVAMQRVGLNKITEKIPGAILSVLCPFAVNWLLSMAETFCSQFEFFEVETIATNRTRYFGAYLDPIVKEK